MKKRILALLGAFIVLMTSQSSSTYKNREGASTPDFSKEKLGPSSFLMQLEMLETLYRFEETYLSQSEMMELLGTSSSIQTCDNADTDYSALYYDIIWNSTFETPNDENSAFSASYRENDIIGSQARTFTKALKGAIDYLKEHPNSDVKEDICHLKTLKFIIDESLQNDILYTYDYETNTVHISFENCIMDFMDRNDEIENNAGSVERTWHFQTYFEKLLIQILNHVRSTICDCRRVKGQKNTTIDPIDALGFITEASSESQTRNSEEYDGIMPINYAYSFLDAREKEALMFFLAAFKPNRNIDDYYKAINDTDIDALHEFFGMDRKKDLYEFYKIAYAFNTYEGSSMLSSEIDDSAIWTSQKSKDAFYLENVGLEHLIGILKFSTEDLIRMMNPEDFTLEEALYLFDFVKGHLTGFACDLTPRNEQNILEYPEYYIEGVYDIESIYYDYLCTIYDIDEETLLTRKSAIKMTYGEFFGGFKIYDIDSTKLLNTFPLLKTIQGSHFSTSSTADWFDDDAKKISKYREMKVLELQPTHREN